MDGLDTAIAEFEKAGLQGFAALARKFKSEYEKNPGVTFASAMGNSSVLEISFHEFETISKLLCIKFCRIDREFSAALKKLDAKCAEHARVGQIMRLLPILTA